MPSSFAVESTVEKIDNSCSDLREDLIGDIFDCLYGLSNITDELSHEIEKITGLSRNQVLAIKSISRSPAVRVSELARNMYLKPVTMVRVLDRLEEQGLIVRVRSTVDRRAVEIELTDKAKDIELVLHAITHDSMMNCLSTADNSELIHIIADLHRLSSLLNAA